jgi:hypothetical protein
MSEDTPLRRWRAHRRLGRGMAPGELQVTRTHVVFEPSGLSARLADLRFSMDVRHLSAVAAMPGRGGWLARRIPRLCLTMSDGSQWEFALAEADEAVEAIEERRRLRG